MNTTAKTAMIAFVMFVAGLSIGATNTPNEYDRACQNFLAEKEAGVALVMIASRDGKPTEPVAAAAERRTRHWLAIMEKFKP